MATSPELGTDGRLRPDNVVALDQGHESNTLPEGRCVSFFGGEGAATPGTYYVQVWRLCVICERDYEAAPVRRLEVVVDAKPVVKPPKRAYGGYIAFYRVALAGVPDGAEVTPRAPREGALARRRRGLRLGRGGRGRRGAPRRQAAHPRGGDGRRIDGRGRGAELQGPQGAQLEDRRARRRPLHRAAEPEAAHPRRRPQGPRVRDGRADALSGITPGTFTTEIGNAFLPAARIAPDGTFAAAVAVGGGAATEVRGRLRDGKVKGRVKHSLGVCSGDTAFKGTKR